MKTLTILKYQWKDLIRAKWLIGYAIVYYLMADALIRFGGAGPKSLLSISNVMLLFVPLISMVYGALHLYQSREFTELLLAQPIKRTSLFWGLYGGIVGPLSLAYLLGVGLPLLINGQITGPNTIDAFLILSLGFILTILFTALGFAIGLKFFEDRLKGLGFALVSWLFLAILYDGLVLLFVVMLGDYPIEKPMLALALSNPIDLARIIVLLKFDISALMGYTGSIFNRFFGSSMGIFAASGFLFLWLSIPLWRGVRLFIKKDF
ncbi:MAG: ABC transporter permease subunit [Balneolaceae bacterium]